MFRKKLFREIKGNFGQFFTIFAMIFLAIMAFSGISAFSDGLKYSSVEFYEKNNLQDLWLYGENFSDDELEKIKALDNVADVERYLSMQGSVDVENTEDSEVENIPAELNFLDTEDAEKNISSLYLRDGEDYSPDKDGVWLGYYFAKARDIQVGDELTFYVEGYEFTDCMFKYAIGDNYDFFANIDISSYLIAIIGTLIIMFVTSIALSRNLKKIDMVASLKANE